ncbi:MAG: hypothetical protein IJ612_07305 [Prevotella sp.]|nr:hypothetical protein [Prevotella sp.]
MRMKHSWAAFLLAALLLTACGPKSRRAEIEQRKAALQHKQDSTLAASQQELAWVDSALEAANARHQRLLDELHTGSHTSAQLKQLGDELTAARLHRDSLQVRFEVLCGKIQYIHRKQAGHQQGDSTLKVK